MRLGWLHDHKLADRFGGAQLTNAAMIAAAPDWADIVCCYPKRHCGQTSDGVLAADAYILNNVKGFTAAEFAVATSKAYIIYAHDLWPTYDQPWQEPWLDSVIEGAEAIIFLSPLHRDAFLAQHNVKTPQVFIIPSPLDPDRFKPAGARAGTVWLGEFQPHKGMKAACRWAAAYGPVDFYGWGPHPPCGPGVRNKGLLPREAVAETLARYETFLFLPSAIEPFARTVAEAALSGCELVCNENVGALSWGWQTRAEWARGVSEAPARFWEAVGEVL